MALTQSQPSALRRFLEAQTSAGLVLMGAAAIALVIANSPLEATYASLLHMYVGPLSVQHWINDGLMALFFLLVGLEIKREVVDGQLSTWTRSAGACRSWRHARASPHLFVLQQWGHVTRLGNSSGD